MISKSKTDSLTISINFNSKCEAHISRCFCKNIAANHRHSLNMSHNWYQGRDSRKA